MREAATAPSITATASRAATGATASAGYQLTYTGTLAIDPRPITVTADAASKTYGDGSPTYSYTVGGDGLVNGDSLSSVTLASAARGQDAVLTTTTGLQSGPIGAGGSVRDVIHLSPGRHVAVGRDKGDWIFPYDLSMSGMHAQIRSEDADFVIMDAGSRNGVGVSVRGEVTLAGGSRILVGDKMLRIDVA